MRSIGLIKWLVLLAIFAAAGLVGVFLSLDAARRDELWFELGKGLIQVVIVVLVGAVVKLLVDRYQDGQERAELERRRRQAKEDQNHQFRQDKYDRLVQVTNQLRRVPILIDANAR